MKKLIILAFSLYFSFYGFSLNILGGQGYALIPDFSFNSPSYDYFELNGVKHERYSWPINSYTQIGMNKNDSTDDYFDFKMNIPYEKDFQYFLGGNNLGSDTEKEEYFAGFSIYSEEYSSFFTFVYFVNDDFDLTWGWAYEQFIDKRTSLFFEKKGKVKSKGYRIRVSPNFFYENIELDTSNIYNLPDKKYKKVVYILKLKQ